MYCYYKIGSQKQASMIVTHVWSPQGLKAKDGRKQHQFGHGKKPPEYQIGDVYGSLLQLVETKTFSKSEFAAYCSITKPILLGEGLNSDKHDNHNAKAANYSIVFIASTSRKIRTQFYMCMCTYKAGTHRYEYMQL